MSLTPNLVYTAIYFLGIILLALGLTIFIYLRSGFNNRARLERGGVKTHSLNWVDLLGLGLFILLYGALLYSNMNPVSGDDGKPKKIEFSVEILLVGMITQFVPAMIVVVLLVFRKINLVDFFGFVPSWSKARLLIVVAPLGLVFTYICFYTLDLVGYTEWLRELFGKDIERQDIVREYQENDAVDIKILLAVMVILIAPVVEEVVFRGYIYPAIKRFSHGVFAAVLSALFFSVVHFNLNALLPLFCLAIILVVAYELASTIWAPILIHMMFNATTIAFLQFGPVPEEKSEPEEKAATKVQLSTSALLKKQPFAPERCEGSI